MPDPDCFSLRLCVSASGFSGPAERGDAEEVRRKVQDAENADEAPGNAGVLAGSRAQRPVKRGDAENAEKSKRHKKASLFSESLRLQMG